MNDVLRWIETADGPELLPNDHRERLAEVVGALMVNLANIDAFRGVFYDLRADATLTDQYRYRLAVEAVGVLAQYCIAEGTAIQGTMFARAYGDAMLMIRRFPQ